MRRTDEAAIEVMLEQGRQRVWYGDPDLIASIADRAGHKETHPLNRSAVVMSALRKSDKFQKIGCINHMGRRYPILQVRAIDATTPDAEGNEA